MIKEDKFSYRLSNSEDTIKIVDLLKICLGDNGKRTVEYWNWKHYQNPFGKSYVMLALDNDRLVGVRSFMKWDWKMNGQIYKCARCVDTVVHPNYRRMGLFSKLTKHGLEIMKKQDVSFIFNTPNKNSVEGYLKMGWEKFGRTGLKIKVNNIFKSIYFRLNNNNFNTGLILENHQLSRLSKISLESFLKKSLTNENVLATKATSEYLFWRYSSVPTFNYGVFIDPNDKFLIFFRLNKKGRFRELRLCDIVLKSEDYIAINIAIKQLMNDYGVDIASLTGDNDIFFKSIAKKVGFIDAGFRGLLLVLKDVNLSIDNFLNREYWGYTAGDIELF